MLIGICTGLSIGLLRKTIERATDEVSFCLTQQDTAAWAAVAWGLILALLAWCVSRILRRNPLIAGSGIPQTELAITGKLSFDWLRILLAKWAGTWLALFGGLALGREGPSIQIGGAVGAGFHQLWRPNQRELFLESPFVVSGAVAGLTAAFGAPIAGIVFAFEEMKCPKEPALFIAACSSALGAELTLRLVFEMGTIFPFASFASPPLTAMPIVMLEGVLLGLLGCGYNRSLLGLQAGFTHLTHIPAYWKLLVPFAVAGGVALLFPILLGGGENLILYASHASPALGTLVLCLAARWLFAQCSTVASMPGGLLMPIFSVGAISGGLFFALASALFGSHEAFIGTLQAHVVFAMAGFFAATVRAPFTGILIVAEMSGAYACLLGCLVCAMTAQYVANLTRTEPIYVSLKQLFRVRNGVD